MIEIVAGNANIIGFFQCPGLVVSIGESWHVSHLKTSELAISTVSESPWKARQVNVFDKPCEVSSFCCSKSIYKWHFYNEGNWKETDKYKWVRIIVAEDIW